MSAEHGASLPHYVALTCGSQARSVYAAAAAAKPIVSVRLLEQGLHNTPALLRTQLQAAIDAIPASEADAVLLVYGLCGNAALSLKARAVPLVIPRAHDCITLYLGSRERYQREFEQHPGTYWYSQDYLERNRRGDAVTLGASDSAYQGYVEKYGQDNADYLMEAMRAWTSHYERVVYIETDAPDRDAFRARAAEKAQQRGLHFACMQGDPRLIHKLIGGMWDEEFLIVPPGHQIVRGDDRAILAAVKEE